MSMDFNTVKEKAADFFEDTKEGLSIMDRYIVKHLVRTRTIFSFPFSNALSIGTESAIPPSR